MTKTAITLYYTSIDGCCRTKEVCPDMQHAREWAGYWVGKRPEVGSYYAVSGDGIRKIEAVGCSIYDLFPEA